MMKWNAIRMVFSAEKMYPSDVERFNQTAARYVGRALAVFIDLKRQSNDEWWENCATIWLTQSCLFHHSCPCAAVAWMTFFIIQWLLTNIVFQSWLWFRAFVKVENWATWLSHGWAEISSNGDMEAQPSGGYLVWSYRTSKSCAALATDKGHFSVELFPG